MTAREMLALIFAGVAISVACTGFVLAAMHRPRDGCVLLAIALGACLIAIAMEARK